MAGTENSRGSAIQGLGYMRGNASFHGHECEFWSDGCLQAKQYVPQFRVGFSVHSKGGGVEQSLLEVREGWVPRGPGKVPSHVPSHVHLFYLLLNSMGTKTS